MVFDLRKEALTASGLKDEDLIRAYLDKLDFLCRQLRPKRVRNFSILTRAEEVFKALWKTRPNRYQSQGRFRLDKVIDAQLGSKKEAVANCLGLTVLYNSLLKMMGIEAAALHLENAFGIGPHVLTIIRIGDHIIDVENILPDGFDYKGHKQNPSRMEWDNKKLVADIYQSIGTELFEKGDFDGALKNYDIALKFNPGYEKAELNRAILLNRLRTKK